jgi:hypothetical protein
MRLLLTIKANLLFEMTLFAVVSQIISARFWGHTYMSLANVRRIKFSSQHLLSRRKEGMEEWMDKNS